MASPKSKSNEHFISVILSRRNIKSNGCWEYNRARIQSGYGVISYNGVDCIVHRLYYFLTVGGFDLQNREAYILHKCDNPPCFNPEHLYLGNRSKNNVDRKGRWKG